MAPAADQSSRCHYDKRWQDAPGLTPFVTSAERVLTTLKWNVTSLVDREAIEGTVMAARAPRLLQFATHGYFLDCGAEALDTPLAQSLLILAGANHPRPSGTPVGDGILTAYEVTGMNLEGTELVNLTACETGVGAVTADGVAGLRQAFLWAGARSLTMSMWEVPVTEVTAQIETFYSRWLDVPAGQTGPSRYEAFRASQIAALAATRAKWNCTHPFFWASTVFVGDPGDLPGTRGGSAS
jgi:CHAT domain-containing protein